MKQTFIIIVAMIVLAIVFPVFGETAYIVQQGESISEIAAKYGVTEQQIVHANDQYYGQKRYKRYRESFVKAGWRLTIPDPMPKKIFKLKPGEKLHTVRRKECLWIIARRYGTTVSKIMQLNSLHTKVVRPGQKLIIRTLEKSVPQTPLCLIPDKNPFEIVLVKLDSTSTKPESKTFEKELTAPIVRKIKPQNPKETETTKRIWRREEKVARGKKPETKKRYTSKKGSRRPTKKHEKTASDSIVITSVPDTAKFFVLVAIYEDPTKGLVPCRVLLQDPESLSQAKFCEAANINQETFEYHNGKHPWIYSNNILLLSRLVYKKRGIFNVVLSVFTPTEQKTEEDSTRTDIILSGKTMNHLKGLGKRLKFFASVFFGTKNIILISAFLLLLIALSALVYLSPRYSQQFQFWIYLMGRKTTKTEPWYFPSGHPSFQHNLKEREMWGVT